MDPVRISSSLPPIKESEVSALAESPKGRLDSAGPSAIHSEPPSDRSGQVFQPSAGDEVLISFEHGDPRSPVLIGGLWNAQAAPASAAPPTKAADGTQPGEAADPGSAKDKWLSEEQAKFICEHLRTSK